MLHHPNNINQLVVQNKYTGQAAPFAPSPLQQYQRYYETVRPLHRHRYSNLTGLPFLVAPLASYGEFPCPTTQPSYRSCHLYAECRSDSKQVTSELVPHSLHKHGGGWHHPLHFDASSMVPLRSSPVRSPGSSSLPFKCIVHYLNPFGRKQHTPVCNLFLQSDCERPTLICIAVTNVTAIPHSHGTLQGASIYLYIACTLH